jgi:hypothetical protein
MTTATAAPYEVARIVYAIRAEGHFCGTPMVCISLADPNAIDDVGCVEGAVHTMSASQVAEEALRVLARKFRRCGVAHNEPYPARGAWAYLGGDGVVTAELRALVASLQDLGFYVALETDAKANNYVGAGIDWVCVAANIHGNDTEVDREAVGTADELRFLIYRPHDVDFTIAFCAEFPPTEGQPRTISVQPVGAENQAAKNLCITQALAYGWRVSMMAYPLPLTQPLFVPGDARDLQTPFRALQ